LPQGRDDARTGRLVGRAGEAVTVGSREERQGCKEPSDEERRRHPDDRAGKAARRGRRWRRFQTERRCGPGEGVRIVGISTRILEGDPREDEVHDPVGARFLREERGNVRVPFREERPRERIVRGETILARRTAAQVAADPQER
jgi:hypothetical protein